MQRRLMAVDFRDRLDREERDGCIEAIGLQWENPFVYILVKTKEGGNTVLYAFLSPYFHDLVSFIKTDHESLEYIFSPNYVKPNS